MKKVAIIGAGPAGLVAAKECQEIGMDVEIFERSSRLGGVWSDGEAGMVWSSLKTNISRHSCCFSDFAWPEGQEDYPTAQDMGRYLQSYASHHDLDRKIRYEAVVDGAQHHDNGVSLKIRGHEDVIDADYMVVASGFFNKALYPFPDLQQAKESFGKEILHAADYKNAEDFKGKDVVVIGGAFGGIDIAASLAGTASSVTHLFRSAPFIVSRYPDGSGVPFNLLHGSRTSEYSSDASRSEKNKMANEGISSYTKQNIIHRELYRSGANDDFPHLAISDTYLDLVSSGHIVPQRISGFSGFSKGLVECGNLAFPTDTVIFATGYAPDIEFLDENMKSTLQYDANDNYLPILAHQATFHPDLPKLGFVGFYKGPYFSVMELQARTLAQIFSGNVDIEELRPEIEEHLSDKCALRDTKKRSQFPYSHISMADSLARLCGELPDLESLPLDMRKAFMETTVVPAHFRLSDPLHRDKAIKELRDMPNLR